LGTLGFVRLAKVRSFAFDAALAAPFFDEGRLDFFDLPAFPAFLEAFFVTIIVSPEVTAPLYPQGRRILGLMSAAHRFHVTEQVLVK
jgi:hypothetical protein